MFFSWLLINIWIGLEYVSKIRANDHKRFTLGWAQWLTLVIPGLWEAKAGILLEPESSRPAQVTQQNPVSTKSTKKLAKYRGACLYSQLPGKLKRKHHPKLGVVAHTCNASTFGGRGGRIT